jgi:hypothetical protein
MAFMSSWWWSWEHTKPSQQLTLSRPWRSCPQPQFSTPPSP